MALNIDIVAAVNENGFFRKVLSTGRHAQVVVMCIPPAGEIGDEVHEGVDQILTFVSGQGVAILDGETSAIGPNHLVHVPAGTRHNVINTGTVDLRLYTVYSPPEHEDGTIHATKAEADADEMAWFLALT
jgi:mannose-6-phosphate isomerase-like protein (cupin superfamily)